MKKLLVLALVLSMATMASAALQIGVNGQVGGTVSLLPSETATLSIVTDALIGYGLGDWGGAALVCPTALGAIAGGAPNGTLNEPGLNLYSPMSDFGLTPPTYPAEDGIGMMVQFTGANVAAGTTLFDGIVFHCNGPGTTIITLWGTQDWVDYVNLGSVTVTQLIPEPMTMGLLGLGGLFLRRRK